MASEIQQPAKAVEGPVKDLKVDPLAKASNNKMSGPKDGSTSDATSCVSLGDATSSTKESEVYQEALMAEQGMYYPVNGLSSYYYPGFDGSFGEWDAQSYYVGADGLESQRSVSQQDNGSVMYYFPGFQPEYTTYNQLLPGAMVSVDGQYLGQQLYYPSSMYSQPLVSPGLFPQSVAYGAELVPAYSWDPSALYADGLYGNVYGDATYSFSKPNFFSQSHTHALSKSSTPSKSTNSEKRGALPLDASANPATQQQSLKPINKASVLSKGSLPISKFLSYPNQGKGGITYPYSTTNIQEVGRTWVGTDKLKARNKVHGSSDFDLLNEQNRGPRTNGAKTTWNSETNTVGSVGPDENIDSGTTVSVVRKDDYNLPEFPTKYDHALFFVIKSYSEDDIHKSIKYNVWSSTPNGNKRLDTAFQVAQEKMAENGSKCPVFLFFSVNASGQFCGVAEMIGRVDFGKNMDFWQQDKWTGYFPVKWHIIKDAPNPQFRHIILENNENKPVTNSRDTQEVKYAQGTEMLNIFKNYSSKTSILDDFSFYENRQKAMQDKRVKQPTAKLSIFRCKETGAYDLGELNQALFMYLDGQEQSAAREQKPRHPLVPAVGVLQRVQGHAKQVYREQQGIRVMFAAWSSQSQVKKLASKGIDYLYFWELNQSRPIHYVGIHTTAVKTRVRVVRIGL